jgi:hypothetical protein
MNNETQFLKKLESITMSTAERARLRDNLEHYADMHAFVTPVSTPSPFFAFMEAKRFPLYASMVTVLIMSGGVMTLAAEGSAPGDSLYGIKINVNEPVMTVLSPSSEGQARIAARLATRRADEVVTLASSGRLTEEKRAYLDDAFTKQINKTVERTDSLEKGGASERAQAVKADLAVSLAGEAQALGAVTSPTSDGTRAFLTKIVIASEAISGSAEATNSEQADEPPVVEAPEPKPLLGKATTTEKTARVHAKEQVRRTRSLFVTASTTLRGSLNTSAVLPTLKVDSAIQVQAPREVEHSFDLHQPSLKEGD